jgi:hypothetical protein
MSCSILQCGVVCVVQITDGVSSNHDVRGPFRHTFWDVADHDWHSEDGTA